MEQRGRRIGVGVPPTIRAAPQWLPAMHFPIPKYQETMA